MTVENGSTGRVWPHRVVLLELDELRHVRVDDLRDLRRAGVDRADRLAIVPSHSAKGVRLAQKMQVGPCIPGEYSYKRLKLAQLLGQLSIFLTVVPGRNAISLSLWFRNIAAASRMSE